MLTRMRVAIAILASSSLLPGVARSGSFVPGDFVTYSQETWGTDGLATLASQWTTIYAASGAVLEVGLSGTAGFSMLFTSPARVSFYLPEAGCPCAPLDRDHLDPTATTSNLFGGEVVALQLNVDYSDAGVLQGTLGIPFGDLVLSGFPALPLLDGVRVRDYVADMNVLLGGGPSPAYASPAPATAISELLGITRELNLSFAGGGVHPFSVVHLELPDSSQPSAPIPEPGAALIFGLGVLLVRSRFGRPTRAAAQERDAG